MAIAVAMVRVGSNDGRSGYGVTVLRPVALGLVCLKLSSRGQSCCTEEAETSSKIAESRLKTRYHQGGGMEDPYKFGKASVR